MTAELCHSRTRGAEVLALLLGILKSFKLFFFPLAILSKSIYLKESLKYAILQMLGNLFSSFCHGRSVNVSDYSYKLLVQVKFVFAFVVSNPVWYVLILILTEFPFVYCTVVYASFLVNVTRTGSMGLMPRIRD